MFGVTYALMWLLCVCNKLNQNILGLDFNLYTITPGLAPLIHLFLSLIINVDLSPYSTRNHICVGYPMQMKLTQKNMESTWPIQAPTREDPTQTMFHLLMLGLILEAQGFALGAWGFTLCV